MTGATTTHPARSPNHQVVQIAPKLDHFAKPAAASDETPIVALIGVLARPTTAANLAIASGVSNARRPSAQTFNAAAPTRVSSVLPPPIANDVASEPAVNTLVITAPARIAGQTA